MRKKSDLKPFKYDGATMKEMLETSHKLANDPITRKRAEKEIRKGLKKNQTFYIDDCGIGHFFTADIYITSKDKSWAKTGKK